MSAGAVCEIMLFILVIVNLYDHLYVEVEACLNNTRSVSNVLIWGLDIDHPLLSWNLFEHVLQSGDVIYVILSVLQLYFS